MASSKVTRPHRAKVRNLAKSSGGGRRRKKYKAPKKDKGRKLDWSNAKTRVKVQGVLALHVDRKMLRALGMNRKRFAGAMEELRKRVAGTRPTIDQLVGTFFEIAGSQHDDILSMRRDIVRANLEAAMQAIFQEKQVFMTAAGDVTQARSLKNLVDAVEWRPGNKKAKSLLAQFDKNSVKTGNRLIDDLDMDDLMKAVAPGSIQRVRDLMIGGEKYCDRAVMLRLKNGQWLLLLSEEYKTPGSGGMNPQQSIRNNRLFNDKVKASTDLKYFDAAGNSQKLKVGAVLLNCDTVGNDQAGIKAASKSEIDARMVRVSRRVRARKLKYGESLRYGRDSNTIFFNYKLTYPSGLMRSMLTDLFHAMPTT